MFSVDTPECATCGQTIDLYGDTCMFCNRWFCRRHLFSQDGLSSCPGCKDERAAQELIARSLGDHQDRLLRLIDQDLAATVGSEYSALALEDANRIRWFAVDASGFELQLIEDLQQRLHDEFVDTTWPACPIHRTHPLWYSDGWWRCLDAGPVARLGELKGVRR